MERQEKIIKVMVIACLITIIGSIAFFYYQQNLNSKMDKEITVQDLVDVTPTKQIICVGNKIDTNKNVERCLNGCK